jgi:purine-binding chemotaxis protein CheW
LISYPEVMTRIPGMPDFIVGMINLRGLVIPVIDLRLRFEMEIGEYDKYTVIIIVQVENKMIGMIVDSVADVVYLEDDKTQASADISTNIDTQFIQGVANIRDDMVILLDVDHLLSEQELIQLNN